MRVAVGVLALMLTTSVANAQYPGAGPYGTSGQGPFAPPQAATTQRASAPDDVVRFGVEALRAFLSKGNAVDQATVMRFAESEIAPYFDFDYMAKFAMGPAWRQAPPAAQASAATWLRTNFLGRLAEYVADYRAARVEVAGTMPANNRNEAVVPVRVWRGEAPPMDLDFRFYNDGNRWLVYDVVANGASALVFYRGYFERMMYGRN